MPDTSTPSPSDPDPTGKKLPGKDKPRLKLKRLIVKDVKINPHVNPDAEPVPHAEPIAEPDPEPIPEEVVVTNTPPAPGEPHPQKKLAIRKPESEEPRQLKKGPEEKEEAEAKIPPAEPDSKPEPKKRGKKKLLFPLLLIFGSLAYGIHVIFDPLGLNPEPIAPVDVPVRTAAETPAPASETIAPSLEISNHLEDVARIDLREFLDKLGRQKLRISENPKGIYINNVFYTEGMSLDPSLGLVVQSISGAGETASFTVVDPDGNGYPIQVR